VIDVGLKVRLRGAWSGGSARRLAGVDAERRGVGSTPMLADQRQRKAAALASVFDSTAPAAACREIQWGKRIFGLTETDFWGDSSSLLLRSRGVSKGSTAPNLRPGDVRLASAARLVIGAVDQGRAPRRAELALPFRMA